MFYPKKGSFYPSSLAKEGPFVCFLLFLIQRRTGFCFSVFVGFFLCVWFFVVVVVVVFVLIKEGYFLPEDEQLATKDGQFLSKDEQLVAKEKGSKCPDSPLLRLVERKLKV